MTQEEKAIEISEKPAQYETDFNQETTIRLQRYNAAMLMAEWMVDKACKEYCKQCDTKECEDYESDTCNWLKKFRQAMKGGK